MGVIQHEEVHGRIKFLVPTGEHFDDLYLLALANRSWPWRSAPMSVAAFEESLYANVHENYALVLAADRRLVGYISVNDVSYFHQFAYVNFYLKSEFQRQGFPLSALGHLIDRLFEVTPLRNVFFDMTESSFPAASRAMFDHVAVLKEKFLVDGAPVDQVIGQLTRAGWARLRDRFEALSVSADQAAE